MGLCSTVLAVVLPVLPLLAGGPGGATLDYRIQVRYRDDRPVVAGGFRIRTTPALVTRNRVKKPRMGGWRIEPLPEAGAAPSPGLLVRALALSYFSGPPPQAVPLDAWIRVDGRRCRLWQVPVPARVGAYAYLVELEPGLLALAYLSAVVPQGELRSVEVRLASAALGSRVAPAEEGTALLRTLGAWAAGSGTAGDAGAPETEEVR